MTCIVGIVHERRVWIGGDTAGTGPWYDQTVRSDDKVFRVGPYLCGFTTSYRMGQILRYRLELSAPDTWDVDRWMATRFVDAVRDVLKANGWLHISEGVETGGTFLVGIADRLYTVYDDLQISRAACGYAAVGSGGPIALGSLTTSARLLPSQPERRVAFALSAAAQHNAAVAGPFTIESTS